MSARTKSPVPVRGSVQNLISKFDNQSGYVHNESTTMLRRAKSMSSLSFNPKRKPSQQLENNQPNRIHHIQNERSEENLEMAQIGLQIRHLKKKLDHYTTYSKDNHIYYQNQVVFILTDLANITSGSVLLQKFEMCEALKKISQKLNTLLPSTKQEVRNQGINKTLEIVNEGVNEKVFHSKPLHVKSKLSNGEQKSMQFVKQKSEDSTPIVKRVHENEEIEPLPSVQHLKALFEKNSSVNGEGKTELRKSTLQSSKSLNSLDEKYIPFREKYNLQKLSTEKSFDSEGTDEEDEPLHSDSKVDPEPDEEGSEDEEESGDEEESEEEEGSGNDSNDSDSEDTLNGEDGGNVDEEEQEE